MEKVGMFFLALWNILLLFGTFCGHLVILWQFGNFVAIW
jgi:hypothetical protein